MRLISDQLAHADMVGVHGNNNIFPSMSSGHDGIHLPMFSLRSTDCIEPSAQMTVHPQSSASARLRDRFFFDQLQRTPVFKSISVRYGRWNFRRRSAHSASRAFKAHAQPNFTSRRRRRD